MKELTQIEIENLRQIISRTDKSGNEKLLLLIDFIYTLEGTIDFAEWAAKNNYHYDVEKNEWWKALSGIKTEIITKEELLRLYHNTVLKTTNQ